MKKQTAAVLGTGALVLTTTLVAAPANADLVTRCVGEGGAVTVPGDLVVPRDSSCSLTGTTVTGDVRVAAGADLIAQDVTVQGRVLVAADGYVDTTGSSVAGEVVLTDAFGAYLETSTVGERVLTRPAGGGDVAGFVFTVDSAVSGALVARSGELFAENSELGSVDSNASVYTDLYQTFVDGTVLVRANELGGVACNVAVQGTARFLNNAGPVQLGSDGPVSQCSTGGSYWGDDVTVNGTTGGVYLDDDIVNGDLTLRNNDPVALVGAGNLVRGQILGEYEEWDGSEPAGMASSSVQAETRRADLEQQVEERQQEAVESAEDAGSADLG